MQQILDALGDRGTTEILAKVGEVNALQTTLTLLQRSIFDIELNCLRRSLYEIYMPSEAEMLLGNHLKQSLEEVNTAKLEEIQMDTNDAPVTR